MSYALTSALSRLLRPGLRAIRAPLGKLELSQQRFLVSTVNYRDKFNVLENPAVKNVLTQVSTLVYEDEDAFRVYRDVLESPARSASEKAPVNDDLKRKLAWRLGRVLLALKRLTFALENHLLNDSEKYDVLVRALLKEVNSEKIEIDDETLQSLLQYYDDDGTTSDDEEAESIPNNYSYLLRNRAKTQNEDKWGKLDRMLVSRGRKVDEKEGVEFSENLLASIEAEIQSECAQLSVDFSDIETHVNKLKLVVLRQWLSEYNDEMIQHQSNENSSSSSSSSPSSDYFENWPDK